MKLYCTELKAIKPSTGELTTFCGPGIPGTLKPDWKNMIDYENNN